MHERESLSTLVHAGSQLPNLAQCWPHLSLDSRPLLHPINPIHMCDTQFSQASKDDISTLELFLVQHKYKSLTRVFGSRRQRLGPDIQTVSMLVLVHISFYLIKFITMFVRRNIEIEVTENLYCGFLMMLTKVTFWSAIKGTFARDFLPLVSSHQENPSIPLIYTCLALLRLQ